MIHLTIDGKPVEVEKGTTILHAAKKVGIDDSYSVLYRGSDCPTVPAVCAW